MLLDYQPHLIFAPPAKIKAIRARRTFVNLTVITPYGYTPLPIRYRKQANRSARGILFETLTLRRSNRYINLLPLCSDNLLTVRHQHGNTPVQRTQQCLGDSVPFIPPIPSRS